MRETKKHLDAFEEYVLLGSYRSYANLAISLSVSKVSIGRVSLRDIANSKQIAKVTDRSIVATKANYRKDIEDNMKIIRATILSAIDPITKRLNITTKTPGDINALTNAYEKLAKLDLLLIGESTGNETVTISVDVE